MKRRTLFALAVLAPVAAYAFLATSFKVGVRDAESGQPVNGAFVIAREFATVAKFHGSDTYCTRIDIAAAEGMWTTMQLPGAGDDTFKSRAIEAIAYRPGYCIAQTANAYWLSSRVRFGGMGAAAPTDALDTSADTRLVLKRAVQTPEERILYLREVAVGAACASRWSDRGPEGQRKLAAAMVAEARSVATSRYEKALVHALQERLNVPRDISPHDVVMSPVAASQAHFPRDFLIAPASTRVAWSSKAPVVAVQPATPNAVGVAAPPQGAPAWRPPQSGMIQPAKPGPDPLVIHCRHGAPSACNLDERDAQGQTALYSFATQGKPAEVAVLLQAGADPNIPKRHGDATPIEVALRRLLYHPSADLERVVDLLAADPRTNLDAKVREDFAADPSTWYVSKTGFKVEPLLKRREALAKLPARAATKPGCENPGFTVVGESRELPMRLRQ